MNKYVWSLFTGVYEGNINKCMIFIYKSSWKKYKQVCEKRTFKTRVTWLFTSLNCVRGSKYVHEQVFMYKEVWMYIGGLGLTP